MLLTEDFAAYFVRRTLLVSKAACVESESSVCYSTFIAGFNTLEPPCDHSDNMVTYIWPLNVGPKNARSIIFLFREPL